MTTKTQNKKQKKTIYQIIKYLSSGALGMATDVGLFTLLTKRFLVPVLISNSIATISATTLNFIIQKAWAFKSKEQVTKSFAKYISVWLFNYCFTMFYLFLTVEKLGYDSTYMKISTYFFITIWNYFLYKNYVYKK